MPELSKRKPVDVKYVIFVIIGLVLMFLSDKFIPTWGPVTPMGVAMLGAFVGLLLLITATGELIWPACAAYIAVIFHGYMDANAATSSFVGTTVIIQMVAVTVICSALRETGAGEVIAKKLLTAKFVQGKPLAFTITFLVAFLFADILLNTFGGIIFSFAVFESVCNALGYKKNDKYVQSMYLGLYLDGMIGCAILPFSGMQLGITNSFNAAMGNFGHAFNPAFYIIAVIPVGVCFMVVYALAMRYIFGCDMSKLKELDINNLDSLKSVSDKFNKVQIIYILAFVFGIAYSFALLILPKTLSWYGRFASITQAAWFILVIVILSFVKVDGKALMNTAKHFKEGANWGFITTVGIFSALGGALSSNDLGIKTWLTEILGPVFSNMSWPVFVLLIVVVCSVVTNFFSNMATGVIVASMTAPFAAAFADSGINVSVIGAAIAYSSMFAYLTYAAAGPAPILLGREGIENRFIWSKGLITLVIYIVVATVVFSLMGVIL